MEPLFDIDVQDRSMVVGCAGRWQGQLFRDVFGDVQLGWSTGFEVGYGTIRWRGVWKDLEKDV